MNRYLWQFVVASLSFSMLTGCGGGTPASNGAPALPTAEPAKPPEMKEAPKESAGIKTEVKPDSAVPTSTPSAAAKTESPALASGGVVVTFGKGEQHSMTIPADWKQETPENNMRLLQVRIPKKQDDPDDGEMMVFKFGGGGGIDANLKRWEGQMGGDGALKLTHPVKTASGKEATVAELEGTYTAMTEGAKAKTGYKMLGAIIIVDSGEVYVKLAGPYNTIEGIKPEFTKMIESFK